MGAPPTRYARSGDARIAFQVVGEGPPDVVFIGGPASHLDLQWEDRGYVRTFERYASFARLIRFDRRGTGLSDPAESEVTLDQQMDDLDAVLETVGTERVALIAAVEAGLCAMYAATHPDRVSALVLANVAEQLSNVVDRPHEKSQAATSSSCVVASSSVTLTPSLNFAPSSTSAISSWPLNRRQRCWAVISSL
jgi:pimeloyl-ACP methyl ester carboxylesterase